MQIFVDSASIDEIRQAKAFGILDGVTTNPSLIARTKVQTGKKFIPIVEEICKELGGAKSEEIVSASYQDTIQMPVSVEVLKLDGDGMIEEGRKLAKIASNVVVKLPCTVEGLKACHVLSSENIRTNLTLCFSVSQALLVAKAGATYVSPFVGRLDDIGEDGMALIANIRMIYNNYRLKTKILTASIRNPYHLLNAARIGTDVVTVPFPVIKNLMEHHLTDKGLQIFLDDAKRASQDESK